MEGKAEGQSASHLVRVFIDPNRGVDFIDQGFLANVQLMAEYPPDSGLVVAQKPRSPTIAWPTMRNRVSSAFEPELQRRLALCRVTRVNGGEASRQFHW